MKARDIMTRDPIYGDSRTTIKSAMKLMWDNDIRHLPLLDDQRELVGVVSERDLRSGLWFFAGMTGQALDQPVSDLVVGQVVSVTADASMRELITLMLDQGVGAVPVVEADDDRKLVGIVSYVDILQHVVETL